MTNYCKDCNHFKSVKDGPRTGIWYNLYCKAPAFKRKPVRSLITGELGFERGNEYPFARDVRKEVCESFTKKRSLFGR